MAKAQRFDEAAQWLLSRILQNGSCSRDEALRVIPKHFGRGLVVASDSGHMRLASGFKTAFAKVAKGTVEWNSSKREWRMLDPAVNE